MGVDRQRLDSEMEAERLALLRRRRHEKDTLLADEPPRALGAGIAVAALLLTAGVAASRAIRYQDTVVINLAVRSTETSPQGEAYLKDVTGVRAGQKVLLTIGEREVQGRVGGFLLVDKIGLYRVTVALPPDALSETDRTATPEIEGRIVTREARLFDRLFGFLRRMSG
jgi:hypothetical protein